MASNLQTNQIAHGVNLMRNIAANTPLAKKSFENMLVPAEVQWFAKQHPEKFAQIMREMALFMGYSVSTHKPLAESINSKTGILTAVGNGGEFTMRNAAKVFTPAQLRAENPLLVINPAICLVGQDGVSISGEFSDEMRQFLKLYVNMPSKNGWYVSVEGAPKGAPSDRSNPEALYLALWSEFGSLWRGDDGRRYFGIGDSLDCEGGMLVMVSSNTLKLVADAEQELGGIVGPATLAVFEALLEIG